MTGVQTCALPISIQAREAVPITPVTTTAALHDILAEMGARLIVAALTKSPAPIAQPNEGMTYAPKLTRQHGRIDWTLNAGAIERRVRAFNPWPGTFTSLGGVTLKILAAVTAAGAGEPGIVLDGGLRVACGSGALLLTRVQLAGRGPMDAGAFLRGHPVPAGTRLGV